MQDVFVCSFHAHFFSDHVKEHNPEYTFITGKGKGFMNRYFHQAILLML